MTTSHEEGIHLDVFAGIGGMSLACEAAGFRTIGFVECDKDRQRDLAHHWPGIPIISDVNDIESICRVVGHAAGRNSMLDENRERESGQGWQDTGPGGEASRRVVADARLGAGCPEQQHEQSQQSGEPGAGGEGLRTLADDDRQRFEGQQVPLSKGRKENHETPGRNRKPFIMSAGVPCQPASSAGQRLGSADHRWLWPQTLKLVGRLAELGLAPDYLLFENPLGIASLSQSAAVALVDDPRLREVPGRTLTEILRAIVALGYELPRDRDGVPWIPVVPAAGVGAFHGRDRLWIIARRGGLADGHGSGRREQCRPEPVRPEQPATEHCGSQSCGELQRVDDAAGARCEGQDRIDQRLSGDRNQTLDDSLGGGIGGGNQSRPGIAGGEVRQHKDRSGAAIQSGDGSQASGSVDNLVSDGRLKGRDLDREDVGPIPDAGRELESLADGTGRGIGVCGSASGRSGHPDISHTLPDWSGAEIQRGADNVWRAIKPGLGLLVTGFPRRVAKLRGFGNSVVPQAAYQIIKAIKENLIQYPL